MRVAVATSHMALRDIPAAITPELLEEKITLLNESLKRDFNIDAPKIAVLSLNPHAGDNGLLGTEEQEVIAPTIRKMNDGGIFCYGPFAADGFMGSGKYTSFDAILAMYHDQGLAPLKALAMNDGVNFTAGLSVVHCQHLHRVIGEEQDSAGRMNGGDHLSCVVAKSPADVDRIPKGRAGGQVNADGGGEGNGF